MLAFRFLQKSYLFFFGLGVRTSFGHIFGESSGQPTVLVGTMRQMFSIAHTMRHSSGIQRTCSAHMLWFRVSRIFAYELNTRHTVAGVVIQVVRAVARYIMSIDPAVVVAVQGVVGGSMGGSVGTSADGAGVVVRAALGQIVGIDLAIVVTVQGVVGGSMGGSVGASADGAAVVGAVRASLGQVVGVNSTIVVAVQWVLGVKIAVTGGRVVVSGLVVKALSTSESADATNVLGDTLKLVIALLTTSQGSTFGLELLHGHGGQSGSLMVSGLVVVYLVNRNSGVNNAGLDGLLLDYGLDSLVDVLGCVSFLGRKKVFLLYLRGGRALRQRWEQRFGCGWCLQRASRRQSEPDLGRGSSW